MSTTRTCPIRLVALSIMSNALLQAMVSIPKHADKLSELTDKSDRDCNTHNCAMWNKRSKQCGLIK